MRNTTGDQQTAALREKRDRRAAAAAKERADIDRLAKEGLPAKIIAQRLDAPPGRVSRIARELGHNLPSVTAWVGA